MKQFSIRSPMSQRSVFRRESHVLADISEVDATFSNHVSKHEEVNLHFYCWLEYEPFYSQQLHLLDCKRNNFKSLNCHFTSPQ